MIASIGTGASAAATAETTPPQPRLVRAAHEFEAQMMKELMKPLTSGTTLGGEDDDSSSGSGGALGEFAGETLAKALSEGGGFGVANKIVQDLSHSGNRKVNGTVTGDLHFDTGIKNCE